MEIIVLNVSLNLFNNSVTEKMLLDKNLVHIVLYLILKIYQN